MNWVLLARTNRVRRIIPVFLSALVAFTLVMNVANAQEATALTPSFGDGRLKIEGIGFKPNERVTLRVKLGIGTSLFTTTADAQGAFTLDTGLTVQPGASVELTAQGNQGSGAASITSVPAVPLPITGAAMSFLGVTLVVGLVLLASGATLAARSLAR